MKSNVQQSTLPSIYTALCVLNEWLKKCMEYEVEGSRPRGEPKRTWTEVVQKILSSM